MPVNILDATAPPSQYPPTSRYYGTPVEMYTAPDGTRIPYLARRLLPDPASLADVAEYTVVEGDRLDLIAFRLLGDAEQWWRIADANPTLDPRELTAVVGRKLRITLPPGITRGA